MSSDYWCCMITRDGADTIGRVIDSIGNQTVVPKHIIIVNDGSTDGTVGIINERAKSFPNIHVIDTHSQVRDIRKVPRLLNLGLDFLKKIEENSSRPRYMMVSGDDNELMPFYAEKIMNRMDAHKKLVVASGDWIASRGRNKDQMPHGAGRFVKSEFMEQVGGKYPVAYGWEPWLLYKALELGYEVKIFPDLRYNHLRPYNPRNLFGWGRAMYSLGFPLYFVYLRFMLNFLWSARGTQSRKSAITMFVGYLSARLEPKALKGMLIDDKRLRGFVKRYCASRITRGLW
ncbi:MAG: glycosyltransferase family 2 protein [Nitrososphaerales archaeon]